MTREAVPRFDLYGELEVSRIASVGVIEAAYRSLVKQHHPDVAGSTDEARIKRLNLAREWLIDPVRRRRYDAATEPGAPDPDRVSSRAGGPGRTSSASPSTPRPTRSASSTAGTSNAGSAPATFGINAPEVRRFLADLRGLDHRRAQEIWDGRAAAQAEGLQEARSAALAVARSRRNTEWLLAREAASVIARGKLGGSPLTEPVLAVVTDIAGAIAIRDLLPRSVFELLLLPWTWRGDPIVAGPPDVAGAAAGPATASASAAAAASAATASGSASAGTAASAASPASAASASTSMGSAPGRSPNPSAHPAAGSGALPNRGAVTVAPPSELMGRVRTGDIRVRASSPRITSLTSLPALVALIALIAVGAGMATLTRPKPDIAVAGITDAPLQSTAPASFLVLPPASMPAPDSASPFGTDPLSPFPTDTLVPTPTNRPFATFRPRRSPTPPPTISPTASPAPTPTFIPSPTAAPTDTPVPTFSPAPTDTPIPTDSPVPTVAPTPSTTPVPMCTVPDMTTWAWLAQQTWDAALFTGPIVFVPSSPLFYFINWQSLPQGSSAPCDSGITVQDDLP